jgi:putative hydrolase
MGLIFSLMSDEQKAKFEQMQSMMSLLEGHASYVMNEVGKDHIRDFDRMKRALEQRRQNAGGVEKSFQRAIGFEQKVRQYGAGEFFVASVVDEAGMETLNRAFIDSSNLPRPEEVGDPARWLARVLPPSG